MAAQTLAHAALPKASSTMKRTIASLVFLLIAQCLLLGILQFLESGESVKSEALLAADKLMHLDQIEVEDQMGMSLRLQKRRGRWLLPALQDLPANQKRVEQLIDTLSNHRHGFPVADSSAARQRFWVASYQYHRRLSFVGQDELLGTVYLGRSPAFRKVYARNDSSDSIYRLSYNHHEVPATAEAWLDLQLLRYSDVTAVSIDGWSIRRGAHDLWTERDNRTVEPALLSAILNALGELSISAIATEATQRSLAESGQPKRIMQVTQDGKLSTLKLFQQGREFYIHDSRYRPYFRIGALQYQRLMQLAADKA